MSASNKSLKQKKVSTQLSHAGRDPFNHAGAVNIPAFNCSTILQETYADFQEARKPDFKGYRYGTMGTPSSNAFEEAVAMLYGASDVIATTSGLAAVTHPFLALLSAGDHVLVTDSVYTPCRKFCDGFLSRFGVETTYYDPMIGQDIEKLIKPNTKIVWTEAPGSLTFEMQDIPAIAEVAHAHDCYVGIDNTWGTPLGFDALNKGCDFAVEAVTKYIGGHSDLLMGVIAVNERVGSSLRDNAKPVGDTPNGDMFTLANRGLRTLKLRYEQSGKSGIEVASWLNEHKVVKSVLHPALPSDPGYDLWKRDFTGAAGLFSIVLPKRDDAALGAMLDGLEFFGIGASWGGYESLVRPDDPAPLRSATEWAEEGALIRLYVGLEDPEDLMADLDAGLERYRKIAL